MFLAAARALPYLKIPQPGPLVTAARLWAVWSELLPSSNLFCSLHGRPTNLELLGQVLRTLIRKISDQEVVDSAADKNIFHQSEFQVPSIQERGGEGATAIPTKD